MTKRKKTTKTYLGRSASGFALLGLLSACGGEKAPAPDTAPPAPIEVAQPADTAPAAPPSRLPELDALLGRPLTDADLAAALALADEVAKAEPQARAQTARLRLAVVAKAAALAEVPPALGAGGIEGQLRLALAATEGATPADADVAKAARAMLGILTEAAEGPLPAAELHALLSQGGPEHTAVKDAVKVAFQTAKKRLDDAGLAAFLGEFGAIVCDGCAAVPETDAPAALACTTPDDGLFCEGLIAQRAALGDVATQPGNQVALAALALAQKVGATTDDFVLPVATPVGRALSVGTDGLRPGRAPLITAALSAEGFRLGLRTIVAAEGRKGAEAALEAAPLLPLAELLEAKADEAGAIAGVSDRFTTTKGNAAVGDHDALLVAIDPAVPAAAVAKALDGLQAAGADDIALARGGQGGEALPALWRTAPEELARTLSPAWERPMIVVVSRSAIDVYAPDGAREGAKQVGPDAQSKLPTSVEQGWRGEKLVRLRVPRPPVADGAQGADGLDGTVLKGVSDAAKTLAELHAAGQLVHVVADDSATAGEVLRIGRHLQEGGVLGTAISKPEDVWAGATCRTAGCVSAAPVLWSKVAVPSSRGLKDKPEKDKKPAEKPAAGPAPSAEFCNAADIKSQMAKKTASFRFCYERELQLEKDLEGRVTMGFIIALNGSVKSVKVSNNALGSAKVADCLSKEIAKIQFKAPDGGECVVQWPFSFRKN